MDFVFLAVTPGIDARKVFALRKNPRATPFLRGIAFNAIR